MARNAKKAGLDVVVYNRTRAKAEALVSLGIRVAETPKDLAQQCDIVVVMVTGPAEVRGVLDGPMGVFSANTEKKLLLQMSTIDVASTIAFSSMATEFGMGYVDAPVAGSKKQVEDGQLIILAGGDSTLLSKAGPFLKAIGKAVVHAGSVGQGTALKLCMNLIVAQMTTALCESIALAKIQNLDPAKIFEVLSLSPALNCGYFNIKEKSLLSDNFSPAFSLSNMLKDVRFIDQAAKTKKLPLPVTQAVRFLMEAALTEGLGEQDLTAISKLLWPKHLSKTGVEN